jgi:hypothetical protein
MFTKQGSFILRSTTGTQSITDLGFTPKVVIFYYTTLEGDGTGNGAALGFGVGISSSDRRSVGNASEHNVTPSINNAFNQNTDCIYLFGGTSRADLVSMDIDGFTINVTAALNPYIINYLAIGGDDLTNVKSGSFTAKTTTGTQSYTGVGFQPDAVLFFTGKFSTPETFDTTTNGAFSFGFATANAEQGYVAWRSRHGANPSVVKHRQSKTKAGVSLTDAGVFDEFQFVSSDPDGFTLNFTTAGGGTAFMYYLALKGGQYKVAAFNQPTSTGNQVVSGLGITPSAALLISANDIAANDDATNDGLGLSFGVASSPNRRGNIWSGDTHNVSPTITKKSLDRTKFLSLRTVGSTPTTNAEADLVSFELGQMTLDWTTADATSREVLGLFIGAVPEELTAGPSLFRGRHAEFFDDDQMARQEFWPALSEDNIGPVILFTFGGR